MKLQVTQENLNKALTSVAKIANTRNTLPILSNVLIKTTNNRLSISATNLDVAIKYYIGAKIEEEGALTVPARLTQEFVNSLPSGVINLEIEKNKLIIFTEKFNSSINGISAEDFPVVPIVETKKESKINAQLLKNSLTKVVFAAGTDETRQILTAVYFNFTSEGLRLVSTDGYRLSEVLIKKIDKFDNILIPSSAINDLIRLIGDYNEEVIISSDEQQVLFRVGDVELTSRLLEGKYPEYINLIPKDYKNTAIIKREDFIDITKVASLFSKENAYSVVISLDSTNNTLSVKSIASQVGENISSATAKISNDSKITLNSRFLLEALNAFNDQELFFGFNEKMEPSVIKGINNPDFIHVIMPLKA